ncbi:MAG TPA: hypothetical protein VGI10_22640 [Polyangiaceae bacterium]
MPTAFVATQRAAVLGLVLAGRIVGSDHFDPHRFKLRIEAIAVVGAVTDQAFGEWPQESASESFQDEFRFMPLTTRNPNGERKTIAVCHRHDLGRFAASSFANKSTPFFAPAWLPSMYASLRSSLPRA